MYPTWYSDTLAWDLSATETILDHYNFTSSANKYNLVSEFFNVEIGTRQGCPVCLLLFIIYVGTIVNMCEESKNIGKLVNEYMCISIINQIYYM